jgi:predicted nucleic acid-binding protein
MIVVADTSPITALLHLKQLQLLTLLYGKIYLPLTVAAELNTLIPFGFDVSFLNDKDVFTVMQASDTNLIKQLSLYIDAGEAEAIALAKELNAGLLLIDEKLGKQFAELQNITCKGVVGVLIAAKQEGLLKEIKPLLDDLILNLNFRLSDKIYLLALQKVNEGP